MKPFRVIDRRDDLEKTSSNGLPRKTSRSRQSVAVNEGADEDGGLHFVDLELVADSEGALLSANLNNLAIWQWDRTTFYLLHRRV